MSGLKEAIYGTAARKFAAATMGIGCIAAASPAFALSDTPASPFGAVAALSDSELSGLRGGFSVKTPLGVMHFDFGVTINIRAEFASAANGAAQAVANGAAQAVTKQIFEMTTKVVFNEQGKVSGFNTTTTGSLPGNTQVTSTSTGGGQPSSNPTGGSGGSSPVTTGPKSVTAAGSVIAVNNPNLQTIQKVTQNQVAVISQLTGNHANFSQTVMANVVVKNFSQIMTNTLRNVSRMHRITRGVARLRLR